MSAPPKPLPYGFVPPPFPRPNVELVSSDDMPMDSEWHRRAMNLLIDCIDSHLRDRTDYYCGGDMFIYFSEQQARNRDFNGPDFFFVWDRPRQPPREWWAIWEEEFRFPNVIIELLAPSTRKIDLGHKKDVYQDIFQTPDYFCYDPDTEELFGWSLQAGSYHELEPNERGQLWSEQLGLWVGAWRGIVHPFNQVWLRFFTPEGDLVKTVAETSAEEVNQTRRQLDAAAAEIARLKAELAAKKASGTPPNP